MAETPTGLFELDAGSEAVRLDEGKGDDAFKEDVRTGDGDDEASAVDDDGPRGDDEGAGNDDNDEDEVGCFGLALAGRGANMGVGDGGGRAEVVISRGVEVVPASGTTNRMRPTALQLGHTTFGPSDNAPQA